MNKRSIFRLLCGVTFATYANVLILSGALVLALPLSSTSSTGLSPLVTAMEAKFGGSKSLQCHFLERYAESGALVRAESGIAYFQKPRKMRWEYKVPEKNLFLADGKNAWFYTPADHTATRIPQRQSQDWRTPLALLTEGAKLSKVCENVIEAKLPSLKGLSGEPSEGTGFECLLKGLDDKEQAHQQVYVEITPSAELARVLILSSGSLATEFRFKDWVLNPALPESLFRFKPALGVVIVDGLLPSEGSVRP